jgi:hypothetical protein
MKSDNAVRDYLWALAALSGLLCAGIHWFWRLDLPSEERGKPSLKRVKD